MKIPGITGPVQGKERGEAGPIRQALGSIKDDFGTRIGNEIITGYNSVVTPRERVVPTEEEMTARLAKKEKDRLKREKRRAEFRKLFSRLTKKKNPEVRVRPTERRLLGSGNNNSNNNG